MNIYGKMMPLLLPVSDCLNFMLAYLLLDVALKEMRGFLHKRRDVHKTQ